MSSIEILGTGFVKLLFFLPFLPHVLSAPYFFPPSHKSVQKILLPFWYQFGAIISP